VNKMFIRNCLLAGSLVLSVALVLFSKDKDRSVILPESAAAELLTKTCSRPGPPKFETTWNPTLEDVQTMESQFVSLESLALKNKFGQMRRPKSYYRQYVGIIVGGRKLIYINAFCNVDKKPPADWRDKPVMNCDGGCDWGAVYDTLSRNFSDLQINGIA
jgi:hypothetical protein